MFVKNDFKIINSIDITAVNKFATVCLAADWTHRKYDRYETSLKEGRLCTLPYAIRTEEHKVYTLDQEKILVASKEIVDIVTTIFPNLVKVRGEVVNLLPGKQLDLHVDNYWFHEYSKRIHVPIFTNLDAYLIFENRRVHLEAGYIYEINNRILHSACNSGSTPRIHLILDLMSQEHANAASKIKGLAVSRI